MNECCKLGPVNAINGLGKIFYITGIGAGGPGGKSRALQSKFSAASYNIKFDEKIPCFEVFRLDSLNK